MMDHQELVEKFSQTVGVEKAEALIAEALADLEIERRDAYSHHEVVDICETIQQAGEGYVRLVANEIRVDERAKRRFDALLDEIRDPVVTVAFEGSTPIVTAMNSTFEETFGYDAAAIGGPLPELIGTGDDDPMDRWRRSDREGSVEIRCRTADGRRRTFLFRSVVVMRERGDVEGYGIYTDITERKRRERELELQNERLDWFASVVSHDLRTPLSIADGHLELARERASDDAVREHLRTVGEAHDRMSTLIDDLLTLARQGRIVDAPEPVPSTTWSTRPGHRCRRTGARCGSRTTSRARSRPIDPDSDSCSRTSFVIPWNTVPRAPTRTLGRSQ